MPQYTPPLRDMQFVMHELLNAVDELKLMPRHKDIDADTRELGARGRRQVRRRGDLPAQHQRRSAGLQARPDDARGAHARRFQGRLCAVRRRRLAGDGVRSRVRRPGPADPAEPVLLRDAELGQPGLDHVPGSVARRLCLPARARHRRAEGHLPAAPGQGRLDRHDVPDRAAVRHRPGPAAHQGRTAGRRQLQAHRPEDLHLRRRARHGGQHRPPGAGAPAGRAGRQQGHLAVRGAEVPGRRRRQAGRAQPDLLRRAGAQDGHPRQRHLPDEPRRRRGHAGGPAEQGPGGDVRDDERGAPGRGQPVAGPDRSGLPERGGLRQGPHPDALAVGPEGPRQAGRPDHRAPRRAQDAADRARLCRRRPRAGDVLRAAARQGACIGRRGRAQGRRRPGGAADADRQGLPHRQRLDRHLGLHAGLRRPRLHQGMGHGAVRARLRAST